MVYRLEAVRVRSKLIQDLSARVLCRMMQLEATARCSTTLSIQIRWFRIIFQQPSCLPCKSVLSDLRVWPSHFAYIYR